MDKYIENFIKKTEKAIKKVSNQEIAKAIHIIEETYERDGRIYIFGNGGSLALATHWVSDFNKTVFSHNLEKNIRRFQAIRIPTTEEELTAWANDVGYDMVFAGPLKNYLKETDCVIAISSSGNSENIIKAVDLCKKNNIPVIGLTGFDGGRLYKMADAKLHIPTNKGEYGVVESAHGLLLHLLTNYFKEYFDAK